MGPIVTRLPFRDDTNECSAECDYGGADACGADNIEKRAVETVEPRRVDEKLPDDERVENCHGTIGDERHDDLGRRHGNLPFHQNMNRKYGGYVYPPSRIGHINKGTKQNDIGWPEWCKKLI